jgi:hypothetical protein
MGMSQIWSWRKTEGDPDVFFLMPTCARHTNYNNVSEFGGGAERPKAMAVKH